MWILQQISCAFQQCKIFDNRLSFDKVTYSWKMETFLRHSVYITSQVCTGLWPHPPASVLHTSRRGSVVNRTRVCVRALTVSCSKFFTSQCFLSSIIIIIASSKTSSLPRMASTGGRDAVSGNIAAFRRLVLGGGRNETRSLTSLISAMRRTNCICWRFVLRRSDNVGSTFVYNRRFTYFITVPFRRSAEPSLANEDVGKFARKVRRQVKQCPSSAVSTCSFYEITMHSLSRESLV